MRILSPSEFRSQPWKNGGGVTHEILRWPDLDSYDVRISIADDRAAGPFSLFPGYQRHSFLAQHVPIHLEYNDTLYRLTELGESIEVDGETPIDCTLPVGPTRLLNILIRNNLPINVGRGPAPAPLRFAYALKDTPWLPAGHAALFDPPDLPPAPLDKFVIWLR